MEDVTPAIGAVPAVEPAPPDAVAMLAGFTGWADIELTEQGKLEAVKAGTLIKELNIEFDTFFTSQLKRANHSLEIILKILNKKMQTL